MLGKQQAVNEQPQLTVGEVPFQVEVRPQVALLRLTGFRIRYHADGFAVLDVVAAVHQIHNVPTDSLAVGGHVVFGFQNLGDVLLTQAMFLVGILPQDIQNVQNQQLFRLFHRHGITSFFTIFYHGISYNARWRGQKQAAALCRFKNRGYLLGARLFHCIPLLGAVSVAILLPPRRQRCFCSFVIFNPQLQITRSIIHYKKLI